MTLSCSTQCNVTDSDIRQMLGSRRREAIYIYSNEEDSIQTGKQ